MSLQDKMKTQTCAQLIKKMSGYVGFCRDQNFEISKIYAKEAEKSNSPNM